MGAKDSKPCCITYEEAVKRVSDSELKRLKDAFKRTSTVNGIMTRQAFLKEVVGDRVPQDLADYIFVACGGTPKGMAFKDLLCGLVLLTMGKPEEKLKFIFTLYANDSGTHIVKEEMVRVVTQYEKQPPEPLYELFSENSRITYEEFREWAFLYPNSTSIMKWLLSEPCSVSLSNDLEMPTFYQTLAGVTHLEETDIAELEQHYWILKGYSHTGKLDLDTLTLLLCPPIPYPVCPGLFAAFDENCDNHIDFKEMACGISAACRGPLTERQKFCFKVFDVDRDGLLSRAEVTAMADAMLFAYRESKTPVELETDSVQKLGADTIVDQLLGKDTHVTLDTYLVWTLGNPLPAGFLNLLFQVCHVVLGLRPVGRDEEGEVVRSWLEREERQGLKVGQVWYLIAMDWWKTWHEYINYQPCSDTASMNSSSSGSLSANNNGKSSPSGSLYGSLKRPGRINKKASSNLDGNVALDAQSSVVVTGITSISAESSSPKKASTNSLTLFVQDSSRPPSATPSPSHSPRPVRKVALPPPRPGPIDNSSLVAPSSHRVISLTAEGGKLKKNAVLVRGRDFELVPETLWRALYRSYGSPLQLPRQVICSRSENSELELYPLVLRFLKHHQIPQNNANARTQQSSWAGVVGGYGASTLGTTGYAFVPPLAASGPPRKFLAYTAAFSRTYTVKQMYEYLCMKLKLRPDDMRLWRFPDQVDMTQLEDEEMTLEELDVQDDEQILIEIRNKDQTWPEEMGNIVNNSQDRRRHSTGLSPAEKGATGLNNLGNTCFMNAALQCVSNTRPLTQYFTSNMHLYELNRMNPLGMKGHIAKRYGDLIQDMWLGNAKTIAPLKLRWTIGRYAPRFNGFQQHDSQELLAFLMDGLHEDLNRVHDKPYVELKDSDGRPDVIVAQEAWENHILRNKSIVVDLFHGQLKSKVICKVCGHESVRFDPFNYLSLPLPMESFVLVEVIVLRLDGSVPIRYGLQLHMEKKYSHIKSQLSAVTGISPRQILLAEVSFNQIKSIPADDQKIKTLLCRPLYAYELALGPENSCSSEVIANGVSKVQPQTFTQIQRASRFKTNGCSGNNQISQPTAIPSSNTYSQQTTNSSSPPSPSLSSSSTSSAQGGSAASNDCVAPETGSAFPMEAFGSRSSTVEGAFSNAMSSTKSTNSLASYSHSSISDVGDSRQGYIIAMHRKMVRQEEYFLSSQKTRPMLFGLPLIVPCNELTTHQDLYQAVWTQVARLVSPLPPSETPTLNHAQDCDDSLGYEYPFVLKAVQKDGLHCVWCPWYKFCRGCRIECCDSDFNYGCNYLSVDWDPTALHLRYQTSQELEYADHESVAQTHQRQSEPIDLDYCLSAFTKEEQLGEDEKYYCSKCKAHQLASKKLQIWRLPPVLIVHLKRFQFVHGKWIKSQKIVRFPFRNFDPTNYLASVPRQTALRHRELMHEMTNANSSEEADSNKTRSRLESTSLDTHPIDDHCLQDFHQHRLKAGHTPYELDYRLYATVCHSGILGGGHYVSYACNPNGKWYCYNDSSCKEVQLSQIDTSTAYMLFYERDGIDVDNYMPCVEGRELDIRELEEELESDIKKMCRIM